jgi:cell division protein FtsN
MADESFREIQLSGKQLIALFMAAAVVLIGTFLSGVLVGRGVRAQREAAISADAAQASGGAVDPTAPSTPGKPAPEAEPQVQPAPPSTPPPQVDESPSLYARGDAKPAAAPAAAPGAGADAKPKEAPAAAAAPRGTEPAGTGYFVKVVAYRTKAQADKVAASLSAKGYAAYVVAVTGSKGPALYSVRVGAFATRKEAEEVKQRLEQEDYKPSIAR